MEAPQSEAGERIEPVEPMEPRDPAQGEAPYTQEHPQQQSEFANRRSDAVPAIRQAVEEVQKISRDLEALLVEMEKALETLEEAEVQKYAEEREIESLRAAVRQLSRVRESSQRPQQPQGRPDNRSRHSSHREQRYQGHRHRPGPRPPQRNAEPSPPAEHAAADQPPQDEGASDAPHERESPF